MKNIKVSQFNIYLDLEDGAFLLRNLFTDKITYVTKEKAAYIRTILNSSDINLNGEYIYQLYNHGFLINGSKIEYQHVDYFRRSISYSTNNLDITILPTNSCNFRCAYCFEETRNLFISDKTAENIISFLDKNMKKYKTVYIQWFGGEPLLCKDVIDRIMTKACEFSHRDKVALIAGITTNGYELDLETYKKLCRYKTVWIQISIDGTKETHNLQRPHYNDPDSYTKIIENLKKIRDNTKPSICKIYYRITISKSIIKYIDNILLFYKNEFSKDNRFRLSLQPVMDWGGDRVLNMNDDLPNVEDTIKCLKEAAKYHLMPIGHHTQSSSALICESTRINSYVFGPGDKVHKCPMAMYSEINDDLHKSCIGEILPEGNIKINQDINIEWVEGTPILGDKCHKCKYYAICHGNATCPYSSKYLNKKTIDLCRKPIYDNFIPAEMYLQYMMNDIDYII